MGRNLRAVRNSMHKDVDGAGGGGMLKKIPTNIAGTFMKE